MFKINISYVHICLIVHILGFKLHWSIIFQLDKLLDWSLKGYFLDFSLVWYTKKKILLKNYWYEENIGKKWIYLKIFEKLNSNYFIYKSDKELIAIIKTIFKIKNQNEETNN